MILKKKKIKNTFYQRLNIKSKYSNFYKWLVGLTDGDGCFSVYYKNKKINFIYKISFNLYNIRALYYIKKNLGIGTIQIDKKNSMGSYTIRNVKLFETIIFPIFDKYPLLTTKFFYYERLKKIYFVWTNNNLNKYDKNIQILNLLNQIPMNNYIAPIWKGQDLNTLTSQQTIISKAWLVGFIEAEGSFYITLKEKGRLVHGFGITQKLDPIILEKIRNILHIKSKVHFKNLTNTYSLNTTGKRAILNICDYFQNNLKTIKSLEFKIWKKAFLKIQNKTQEKKYNILLKARESMILLRKYQPSFKY